MRNISAIVILVILTTVIIKDIIYKDDRAWAFVIFFQHIPLIIFNQLGSEFVGIIYFSAVLLIIYLNKPKVILIKYRYNNPIIISLFILTISLLFHYFVLGINSNNEYGFLTHNRFVLLNVPLFIIIVIGISTDEVTLNRLMEGVIFYGILFVLTVYFVSGLIEVGFTERHRFRDEFRISPLAAAQTAGIIIIATILKIINSDGIKNIVTSSLVMLFSLSLLFVTASRAALLFLLIILLIYFAFTSYKLIYKVIIFSGFSLVGIISFYTIMTLNLPLIDRITDLQNYEEMLRYTRFQIVFDIIKDFNMGFFGLGPYGFGFKTGLQYPHNYILELIVDYGVPGIISALLLIIFGIYYSFTLIVGQHNYVYTFYGLLFLYLFFAVQTTGDIVYARNMQFSALILVNTFMYLKYDSIDEQ